MLASYHENPQIQAVRLIYITDPAFPYGELEALVKKGREITRAIDHAMTAPIADHENTLCAPIFSMGAKVLQELERLVDTPNLDESTRIRFQSDYQQLLTSFSYLF